MRRSEILAVRWEHIRDDEQSLLIPQTKNGYSRIIPLSPRALENAREAMSLAMNETPDLVVMDIYLNGARDGIEAARSIRETFGTQIVFVTAYSDDDGIMERIHQQVPDAPVLPKPLYGNRLASAIEQLHLQPPKQLSAH
jgi:CheY-like chemotaxis protein